MEHPTTYVPKSGDKVSVSGHTGQFIVHSVDNKRHTVDVRLIGPTEAVNVVGMPWKTLKLLSRKREDVNQAAARIVRENRIGVVEVVNSSEIKGLSTSAAKK